MAERVSPDCYWAPLGVLEYPSRQNVTAFVGVDSPCHRMGGSPTRSANGSIA